MQDRVYLTDVHSFDELKQWLDRLRCNPDKFIINTGVE